MSITVTTATTTHRKTGKLKTVGSSHAGRRVTGHRLGCVVHRNAAESAVNQT